MTTLPESKIIPTQSHFSKTPDIRQILTHSIKETFKK